MTIVLTSGTAMAAQGQQVQQQSRNPLRYKSPSLSHPSLAVFINVRSPCNPLASFKTNPGSTSSAQKNLYTGLKTGTYYAYARDANVCSGRSADIILAPATGWAKFNADQNPIVKTNRQLLEANLSPYPSRYEFILLAGGVPGKSIEIKVLDAVGKMVYYSHGNAEQPCRFGANLRNGLLLVEVRQRDEVKIIKSIQGQIRRC